MNKEIVDELSKVIQNNQKNQGSPNTEDNQNKSSK